MIKGGALPPFFLKANPEQPFIQLANDLALSLPETMLARGQVRFSSEKGA